MKEIHDSLTRKIARKYEKAGYKVYLEPENTTLPFDLGYYRPDLLVLKSENSGYVIEVKARSVHISVDRLREIAETVTQHEGWRFLLITGDDLLPTEAAQDLEKPFLSWAQILARKEKGDKLVSLGELEGAFMVFWGTFEALLRNQAAQVSIPIERFPTSSLINHLYSQGELSIAQFDGAKELLKVSNQLVHGFQTQNLAKAVTELRNLLVELLDLWHSIPLQN